MGVKLRESSFDLSKVQAKLISDALSEYDGFETDVEREVGQRTERLLRERIDIE